jgi:hypothetical protein
MMENKGTYKEVFTINDKEGRSYWTKLGVAFPNKDGSLNLYLDALPVNGRLQIRDAKPKEERAPRGFDFPHSTAEAA